MSIESRAAAAIWTLGVDSVTAEVSGELEEAGVRCLLLKGPSVAQWLYADPGDRAYGDTDLLVAPADAPAARQTLTGIGFRRMWGPVAHPGMREPPSHPWRRDAFVVDLHEAIVGTARDAAALFDWLWEVSVAQVVAGRSVRVLGKPARLVHVALHAAHHGPAVGAPVRDVDQAVTACSQREWEAAAAAAVEMGALDSFALGISLAPNGPGVLERLGLVARPSVDWLLEMQAVPLAGGIERFRRASGIGARARMLRDELAPSPAFMRWWTPLARRSRRGLAASYICRVLFLAGSIAPALWAWARATRRARSGR